MATPNDIYNEINRINNAKYGIAEAIEEKGVEVPAGSRIGAFPELVRQIQTGPQDAVLYTPQELDAEQQAQARVNIAAQKTIDESNKLDYSLLENTPEIPAPKMYLGICETDRSVPEKEATTEQFPVDANGHPLVGTMVGIKFTANNNASNMTLNVNNTGAYPMYYNAAAATGSGTQYGGVTDRYVFYVFDGTYWVWFSYGVDQDTNTIAYYVRQVRYYIPFRYKTYRYRLLFTSPDGREIIPANKNASTSETAAKTPVDDKIDPFGTILYYSTTTAVNAGSYPASDYQWTQYGGISLGYSFSNGSAWTLTIGAPVYLKCAPQADGMVIIDATTPIVQALPATDDGKVYIFLGYATSETQIGLWSNHPVYYIKNGARRVWTGETI